MKRAVKITAAVLAAFMALQLPLVSFGAAAKTSKSPFVSGTTYTHQAKVSDSEIANVVDLSYYQGSVNFSKLKKDGCDAVILRVGYRGHGTEGNIVKDVKFDTYMASAKKVGLPVGVYFYSQALSVSEAKAEADFVLSNIKNYSLDLPVYFDYEFAGTSEGRLNKAWSEKKITKQNMTNNAIAFCETVENAGYSAGVYASKYFFYDNCDYKQLQDKYSIWLAHYATKTDFSGTYQIWQYSSEGKTSGAANTYIDCNFMYKSYMDSIMNAKSLEVEDISSKAYTGDPIKPSPKVTFGNLELIKGEDYYLEFENNTEIGTAKVKITGVGTYAEYKPVTKEFSIVPSKIENLKLDSRGTNSLEVSWDNHENADKYKVQVHRSTGWVTAGTTTQTKFNITDLATASNYRVRVAAVKTVNKTSYTGKYSSEIETATKPTKPSNLSASAKPTSIKLSWKKQTNASYYEVYKFDYDTEKYNLFKTVNGGKNNSLNITGLKANTKYRYKVKAYKKSKDGKLLSSEKSDGFTTYTTVKTPTLNSAKSTKKKSISAKWTKVSGASGYQVMWSTTSKFTSNYKSVYVSGAGSVSKAVSTAQSGKKYYVRVRAYKTRNNKKVYSPWSKTLNTKTK